MEKNMIKIQSSMNVRVTAGLQYQDFTPNVDGLPNRLRVQPEWVQSAVMIEEGVGYYPAEIAEWETTKSLVENGIISIMSATDTQVSDEDKSKADEIRKNIKIMKEHTKK